MNNKILITIDSQYGSGGRDIAERVSQMLHIDLYDKEEILKETENLSEIDAEILDKFDENPTNSFLYSLAMGGTYLLQNKAGEFELPIPEKIFLAEFNEIKKIADEKSAVFVSRCADYALADYDNCVSIFIYAPIKKRMERIMERQNVNKEKAEKIIRKVDKKRAAYYNYYTSQKWGDMNNYHLCIDSSLSGTYGTANIIRGIIEHI